jgi:hypothetical protein
MIRYPSKQAHHIDLKTDEPGYREEVAIIQYQYKTKKNLKKVPVIFPSRSHHVLGMVYSREKSFVRRSLFE